VTIDPTSQPILATYAQASVVSATKSSTSVVSVSATVVGDTVDFSATAMDLASARQSGARYAETPANAEGTTATSGDTVSLSDAARDLGAAGQTAQAAQTTGTTTIAADAGLADASQIGDAAVITPVTTVATASGRQISLAAYTNPSTTADETGQAAGQSGYLLTIGGNGESGDQRYVLTGDVLLNEDASGNLSVAAYAAGKETSGDDLIIGLTGAALNGGDGNDTLVALADGNKVNVSGGAGDDTVIVSGNLTSGLVHTGEGNDTLTANITAGGNAQMIFTADEGNDTVQATLDLSGNAQLILDTGNGNDSLTAGLIAGDNSQTILATGNGNDRVVASLVTTGNAQLVVDSGDGNDALATAIVATDNASVRGHRQWQRHPGFRQH
jgi:hypothetical protein